MTADSSDRSSSSTCWSAIRHDADRLAALRRSHRQRLRLRAARAIPRTSCSGHAAPARRRTASRWWPANHEFSSGQFEINLWHSDALDAADRAFRFKAAIQELARQRGQAGHLHGQAVQRRGRLGLPPPLLDLVDDDGDAALRRSRRRRRPLRRSAKSAIAGVLAHAPALAALCNPTINSYKRFGPDTLAPWLIDWGLDNRSAMVRIPPERGAGVADGAAARRRHGQPLPGDRGVCWPPPTSASATSWSRRPRSRATATTRARPTRLPGDLATALDALEADTELRRHPRAHVRRDRSCAYKRNELERFSHWVTDWEFREYAYHL